MKEHTNSVTPLRPTQPEGESCIDIRMHAFGGMEIKHTNSHPALVAVVAALSFGHATIDSLARSLRSRVKDE